MPIRKVNLKNGPKFEVRFYVNGRGSRRICKKFDTRQEAIEFEHSYFGNSKVKFSVDHEATREERKLTFKGEAEMWLKHKSAFLSPGHKKRVQGILKVVLNDIGDLDPLKISRTTAIELQQRLMSTGLKHASVNRMMEVVCAVLNYSAHVGRIPYHPLSGFKKLKMNRKHLEFWSRDDALKFLTFVDSKYSVSSIKRWVYVAYLLALNTGIRAGEMWGLRVSDLMWNKGVIHVRGQYDRVSRTERASKGNAERFVPFNSVLKSELENHIKQNNLSENDLLFQNKKGQPICHDNFNKRNFWTDLVDAKVSPIRFHDLRHTAATLMIDSGVEPTTVKEILGHSNIQTTMIYVHLLADSVVRAASRFELNSKNSNDLKFQKSYLKVV